MGKFGWIVTITLVFSLSLLGCEKLPEFLKFGRPKEVEVARFPPSVEEGEVLARINDRVITLDEFNQRIEALPEELKDIYLKDPEAKSAFLDELINRELLIKEAIDRRLDQDEEVARLITAFKDQILVESIIARESEKVKVIPAEVESFFNVYKDRFVVLEERKVRTIVLATEEEAKSVLIELLKGVDFAALAKEKSIGPAKENGGDIGFIVRKTAFTPPDKKTMFPQFENAAFSLDLGRVSSIVKGPDGYYIIKLEEKKGAKQRTLYEVWDDLEKEILVMKQRQVIAELVDNLRKKAKVEIRKVLLEVK